MVEMPMNPLPVMANVCEALEYAMTGSLLLLMATTDEIIGGKNKRDGEKATCPLSNTDPAGALLILTYQVALEFKPMMLALAETVEPLASKMKSLKGMSPEKATPGTKAVDVVRWTFPYCTSSGQYILEKLEPKTMWVMVLVLKIPVDLREEYPGR